MPASKGHESRSAASHRTAARSRCPNTRPLAPDWAQDRRNGCPTAGSALVGRAERTWSRGLTRVSASGDTRTPMVWVGRIPVPMVMKRHPPQFEPDTVPLDQERPGPTIASVADDLGDRPGDTAELDPGAADRATPRAGAPTAAAGGGPRTDAAPFRSPATAARLPPLSQARSRHRLRRAGPRLFARRAGQDSASSEGETVMENGCLSVETLGPLRAHAEGREILLGPPKQRAVFAVLALRTNSVVSRDDLIDYIWGEAPPATAAGSLHTYVSGLRRTLAGLGAPLTSSGSGYALQLDPGRLDIRVVERLAARARTSRAQRDPGAAVGAFDEALAHWHPGSVLSGLPGPFAAEHRTWVADLRLRLLLERAELLLELERPTTVADQLRGHVPDNPYHERLRALLMTALRQSGRTADALAQYHELRKLLAEDLGIDPSAELQSLYSSMLTDTAGPRSAPTGPAAAAPVRPAQLPRGVGGFVGRVDSVRQVLDVARTAPADGGAGEAGCPQIVMLVGVAGVGKTALAVHCGHLLAAEYPDGQLYVNLRGFDPKQPASSPVDALHHLLTSLDAGTIPADQGERVALWRSIVRDKRMLIVLDNAASADQVEDLLPGGGPSFTVVTSRNRLSGLAVRYSARRVTLSPFTAGESLRLLSDSIGSARVDAETSAARRLAELCDHLPLALRIASEQVTAGPRSRIADLIADLEDVRRRLDALQIPDDELYSARGVLSWSYARLDAATAHAFRTLGLFPGVSIRVEVAAALLNVPPSAATAALRSLAAQHLVETTGTSYRMHDLTRIYAEEVARGGETSASRRAALERVLRWYVRILTRYHQSTQIKLPFTVEAETETEAGTGTETDSGARHEPLRFDDQKAFVAWCAQEWENIAPLVRTAQRIGCHEQAWQLAYLLFDYFYATGQAREWMSTLQIGLRSAEMTENRRAQAVLLNHLGVAHARMGQNSTAVQRLQRGLRLLDDLGDDVLRTGLLGNLASALRQAKDYAAALPYARQALRLAHRIGLAYYSAGCLDVLCELHAELGEFEEALRCGRPGLTAARRCRNVLLEANILINLGVAELGLDNAERAQRHFQDALSVCESSGDRYHEAVALFGLAKVYRTGSARQAAHGLATRALRLLKELEAEEVADVMAFLRTLAADLRPAAAEDAVRRAG
ncbi:BTAD domain-containing putative transcriptional regulator [Kitasatospora sp. GAS1066B]|uniref:AfsR/SARP family transcriptional regulator n=1 Tax=Kitasatospora sp. GAS1066B TaxID=3156271 RepID=UPI00351978F6